LKNDLGRFFVNMWRVLSEVPGWPDAPVGIRLRRAAPILVAVVGMIVLVGWKYGWREPDKQVIRDQHAAADRQVLERNGSGRVRLAARLQPFDLRPWVQVVDCAHVGLVDEPRRVIDPRCRLGLHVR